VTDVIPKRNKKSRRSPRKSPQEPSGENPHLPGRKMKEEEEKK